MKAGKASGRLPAAAAAGAAGGAPPAAARHWVRAADRAACRAARRAAHSAECRAAARACRTAPRRTAGRRRPAVLEILVLARLELLVVAAAFGTRLEVRIVLAELLLRRRDQAEIMFGVLEIIFRRDRIAGGLGVTRELEILLRDVIGRSADLHVGPVGFIDPCQRVVAATIIIVVVIVVVVAPTHALVVMMLLTVSHGLLFNNSRCGVRHSLLTRSLDRRRAGTKFKRSPRHPGEAPTSCAFRRRSGRDCPEHPCRPRPCCGLAHLLVTRGAGTPPCAQPVKAFESRYGGSLVSSSGNSLIRPVCTAASRSTSSGPLWLRINLGSIP